MKKGLKIKLNGRNNMLDGGGKFLKSHRREDLTAKCNDLLRRKVSMNL